MTQKVINIDYSDRDRIISQLNNACALRSLLGDEFHFIIDFDIKSLHQNVMAFAILIIIARLNNSLLDKTYIVNTNDMTLQDIDFHNKLLLLAKKYTKNIEYKHELEQPKNQVITKIIEPSLIIDQPMTPLEPSEDDLAKIKENNERELKRINELEKRRTELKEKRKRSKKKRQSDFDTMQRNYKNNRKHGIFNQLPTIEKDIKQEKKDIGIKHLYHEQFVMLQITDDNKEIIDISYQSKRTNNKETVHINYNNTTWKDNTRSDPKVNLEKVDYSKIVWRTEENTSNDKVSLIPKLSRKLPDKGDKLSTHNITQKISKIPVLSEELTNQIYNTKWRK